jgi:hypothetical protein
METMKSTGLIMLLAALWGAGIAHAQAPPPDQQVAAAVHAAPDAMQAGAAVKGYNEASELVTLREGSNELICVADEPGDDRFHVACYHKRLEPFMQRGRDLRAEGVDPAAVDSIRRAEIERGALDLPSHPMALYSLTGPADSYDAAADSVSGASPLYVVYTPFATGEELGLPTRPTGNVPWLMEPGTPWAHIMITSGGN